MGLPAAYWPYHLSGMHMKVICVLGESHVFAIAVCWWPLQSTGAGRLPYPPKTVPDWGNIVKDTIQTLFQVTFRPPHGNKLDFGRATRRSLRNISPEIGIGFYISGSSHWVKRIVKRNYWFMAVSVSTNCFLYREMVLLILSMTKPGFGQTWGCTMGRSPRCNQPLGPSWPIYDPPNTSL